MGEIVAIITTNGLAIAMVVTGLLVGASLVFFAIKSRLFRSQQQLAQHSINELREQNITLQTRLQGVENEKQRIQELLHSKEHELNLQRDRATQLGEEAASLKTALKLQQQSTNEKLTLLSESREQLTKEFELLANRIFEEKNDRFNKVNQSTLDNTLKPLKEQLTAFKQKVEDVYDKDSKERVSLVTQLSHLKELNQQMSIDAINLTNALKGDNKTQGNWGEVILERVLEESGLRKGREYDTQVTLQAEDGGQRKPDVIVRLPEQKDIIIDAKVSLRHYERFCNSIDAKERELALHSHIASVRTHIKELSIKDYEKLEGIRTLDFVFVFIPIEPAFMAAFEHDPAMFKVAYEKNVIIVGPTTLLATLRTVQSIWRYERQNKNAEEIARQAGAMHDKFVGFVGDLNKISTYINKASDAHISALSKLSSGSGNLVSRTRKLEQLGAKVKKVLPDSVLREVGSDEADLIERQSSVVSIDDVSEKQ